MSPTTLGFASTALGTTAAPLTVTLSNTGGSSFTIKSIANDPQFRAASGTCFTSPIVPAGASCTFNVTFTPTTRGPSTGSLTVTTDVLPAITIATSGSSPTTTSLTLAGKTYTLAYPTSIGALPDTDPATLTTDVTASLWNLVSGASSFGTAAGSSFTLTNAQPLASIPWPIRFRYWRLEENLTTVRGTGCQIDLVGSTLVVTANGISTSVPVDGTAPVLNRLGQAVYPGDAIAVWASQRTVGTSSVVRAVQIDAFDGALLGSASAIQLLAVYDSYAANGLGVYGTVSAIRQTASTLQSYVCSDTP